MKNRIVALMLCFLLAACGKVETPPTDPTVPSLAGVWVNAGQYSEGHTKDRSYSFTVTDTTLTLTGDGKAVEYRRS